MAEYDFTLDGVSAASVGIRLQRPVMFSEAETDVQTFSVVGLNGDLHIDEGRYKNRTGTADCFALSKNINEGDEEAEVELENVTLKMSGVAGFLFGSKGYRRLQTSEDPDNVWYARVEKGAGLSPRLNLLNPFTITFDCKPFKTDVNSETLISGTNFTNPTAFDALPLIYVISSAEDGTLTANGVTIRFVYNTTGGFYIDCETGTAYYPTGIAADDRISAKEFIRFVPGENIISSSGVNFQIAPRWRIL